ncbi:MAG TPA: hypothetical protein VFO96_12940 [Gemmatimonadales bacterium]|jgi:hypothetical protein|nr:hypothetical protein [Gemmatimonadales bacterium]
MRAMMLAATVTLTVPAVAEAQGAPVPIHLSAELLPRQTASQAVLPVGIAAAGSQQNYWLEGAIGGGVLLGAATALFAYGLCKDPDSNTGDRSCGVTALLGALPGATAGGVIGAFVGKTIPKHVEPDTTP